MPSPGKNTTQLRWISSLISLAALLALVALVQHYLQVGSNAISRPASSDFYKFYLSGQRLNDGLSMYWLVPPRMHPGDACHPDTPDVDRSAAMPSPTRLTLGGEVPCLGPNLNPPIFMVLMLPLSQLPYGQAWWIWAGFSSICIVLSAWLLSHSTAKKYVPQRFLRTLVLATALFAFYPTLANFSLGQLGSLLLLLLTLSWTQLSKQALVPSGFWLGLAIAIKPFLGLLVIGLLITGRWRMALATATCTSVLSMTGILLFGWTTTMDYLMLASNVTWTATNWNASWIGFVDRALIGLSSQMAFDGLVLSRALGWTGVTLIVTACWSRLRTLKGWPQSTIDAALFSVAPPIALIASPLGWMYYFPMLILSGLIAWQQLDKHDDRLLKKLALFTAALMAMVPITLTSSPSIQNPPNWLGIDSWCFYTLCACSYACWPATRQRPE